MIIELSGVPFGPKLYARFHNQTSAQRKFDFKLHVWFQIKFHGTKFTSIFIQHKYFIDPVYWAGL